MNTTKTVHHLKVWLEYYPLLWDGLKTCEIRKEDDRKFNAGDILVLHPWDKDRHIYSALPPMAFEVTHIVRKPFLPPPLCAMSIKRIEYVEK